MAITGSGTSGSPYLLSTFSELEVIGSDSTYTLAKYYKLGDNIDASATSDPGYNSGAEIWFRVGILQLNLQVGLMEAYTPYPAYLLIEAQPTMLDYLDL